MSNPTTPFNWQMPTNTDLVTDLPADFEVFGQAVATSMADLLGGTTGQILAKNSNTDMDFVWIANDQGDITGVTATSPLTGGGTSGAITVGIQASSTTQSGAVQLTDSTASTSTTTAATPNSVKTAYDLASTANTAAGTAQTTANAAIPKSTVTTAGDVIYATGSSAVTRLGIGSSGQVLTVAAGVPSWATPSASASGLTLISPSSIAFSGTSASTSAGKTVFSACTSLSLNGVFTSTYENYLIIWSNLTQNSNSAMTYFRYRLSGTDTTSGYSTTGGYQNPNAALQYNPDSTTAHYAFQLQNGGVRMTIMNPQTAGPTKYFQENAATSYAYAYGSQTGSTQFDGFTVYNASNNFTGTVRVYGYQN